VANISRFLSLTRATLIVSLLVFALLGAVLGGARWLIARDRHVLLDKFAAERLGQVEEAADLSRRDLEGVAVALQLAGRLASEGATPRARERELTTLLETSDNHCWLAAYDLSGHPLLSIANPRLGEKSWTPAIEVEMRSAAVRAIAKPGEMEMSFPLVGRDGRALRVFAIGLDRHGAGESAAVALLIDSHRLLSKLSVLASDPAVRLLLLGPHGMPTPSSDERLAAAARSGATDTPRFAEVVSRLRAGQRGTVWLPASEAAALGGGDAAVLAAFAPLGEEGKPQWGLAIFTSTSVLQKAESSLASRFAIAAAAVALLLIVFGAYVAWTSRREALSRERLLHAERLAQLHARTERTLDSIPSGVMTLSADQKVLTANMVVRSGLTAPSFPCTLAEALPNAPASVHDRLTALVATALSEQEVQSLFGQPLALFGREAQYTVYAVPLGGEGEARALLVFEDVSEVRSLESQLLRAEKLATIGVLAAGLAHEVGTPLGIVRGRAEYVLGKLGSDHPQARNIAVITEQIDRVTRTIRQMLDFTRVTPAAVKPVAIPQVAGWLAEVVRYEAQRRKVALKLEVPDTLPVVSANPDQLQQLLLNLVMNACDACSEGGNVTLSAAPSQGAGGWPCVRLCVSDDGCGIPEDHMPGVFDPFFTTKKRGQGTGLGLTVAAHIVRNHGGQIELESEVGRGTRVVVLWPVVAGQRVQAS
jgi:two-component system, NtrC family, sensor histidine kinase HydH